MSQTKRKVLLIGWDGADWEHINPLIDNGLMPTLNQFVNEGSIGNLATLQPVLSPMLWNSVATCKFADKHGIHGFVEPDLNAGGSRPFFSSSRKTKALWNIFSQNGIRSNVINWWASHPAEKIDGFVASNLFNGVKIRPEQGWVITPGTIHPAEKSKTYAPMKFFPHEMSEEHILPFIPGAAELDQEKDRRLSSFAKTFSEMMTTHSLATSVMENEPWEFMAIYYTGIDHFSHGFMQYHPPQMKNVSDEDFEMYKEVIKGAYRFHDMMLERLLQLAGDDTTVIICSDHGFQSGAFRPVGTPREPAGPAAWHRQYGMLAMRGAGIKQDERIYGASLIDIGPTILHLFGLPIGEDMDGRPLVEAFDDPEDAKTIPSWDDVPGEHGMQTEEAIASSGVSSEELVKQFIALGYIEEQGGDKEKQALAARIENDYNLARCLTWQGRYDEAQPLFEKLAHESPWENRFILHLADTYFQQGYLQQAKQTLGSAFNLEKTPTITAIVNYAEVCLALGQQEEGMKYLKLASMRSPNQPTLCVKIGRAFAKQRQWDQAAASYKRAIQLHPDHARAYQGLAAAYLRTGQNQLAADAALDAVALIYRLPAAHLSLGIAMARSKQYDRAILAFQTALKFAPKMRKAHRWLGVLHRKLGNEQQATQYRIQTKLLGETFSVEKKSSNQRRDELFPLPDFAPESDRIKRLIKERPRPGDKIEKSGKTFVVVSGLPRSGTSLMMQMLAAGGIEPITDGERVADQDNPRGYFEWEPIKKIGEQPELLDNDDYDGKALKVISMLLKKLPNIHDYKVIFMLRPIDEIAKSQSQMIARLETEGAALEEADLKRGLKDHRNQILKWLKSEKHMEHVTISYSQLMTASEEPLSKIQEFLGSELLPDPAAMASAIDPSLYRNRNSGA